VAEPTRHAPSTVGIVGLGLMGGGIARRLLAAGHAVHGYNRSHDKAAALASDGLVPVATPGAAAEAADVVLTVVTDGAALNAVADGILEGLRPGAVWIDMSTVSPATSRGVAERARERGAEFADAPISGSVSTLESGQASIMFGGSEEAFEQARTLLLDIAPTVTRVGDNGAGLLLKLAINLSLTTQIAAFSEGLLLAEKAGIDRELAVDVMLRSAIASPMLKYRGPFVLERPDEAWFDVNMMQKDVLLALDGARELDVPMPTTALSNELLTAARGLGLEHEDFAVVYDVLAELAGLRKVER
jgi:3-hydroxyisobutyrate dehydrogenase-like beta-hydroxyacid dehydrogenase